MLKLLLALLLAALLLALKVGLPSHPNPGGGSSSSSSVHSSSASSSSVRSSSSSSSASSQSSSSSAPTSLSCATSNGVLFVDSVCEGWALKIWEAKSDYSEIAAGYPQVGQILSQNIVDSEDVSRGKVLDINYNSNSLWSGLNQFRFADSAKDYGVGLTNMSDFVWGKISLDIKVISNPNAVNIVARVECGWPCNSKDIPLTIPALNQWVHVELPITDLIAQGVNLNHVDVALDINPEWGKQAGTHLQIDNVQWEKGTAPAMTCATDGAVFVNGSCAPWQNTSYFEQKTDHSEFFAEVFDYSPGHIVTQTLLDSGEVNHQQVLDIQYNSATDMSGGVRNLNPNNLPDGVDMSAFKDGIYVFDIKVLNIGDANADLISNLDCGWPCSTEQPIKIKALNQWQTVAISVRELINAGVDIQHLRTGFQILPEWGHQANWHYQIDNVRWFKTAEVSNRVKCFGQHFNATPFNYTFIFDSNIAYKNLLPWQTYLGVNETMNPNWNDLVTGEKFRFLIKDETATLTDCINTGRLKNGVLTGQVYLADAYAIDGKIRPNLMLLNGSYNYQYIFPANNSQYFGREWTTVSFNLSYLTSDVSDIRFVGFQIDPNGKDPAVSGVIKMDNFVITMDK